MPGQAVPFFSVSACDDPDSEYCKNYLQNFSPRTEVQHGFHLHHRFTLHPPYATIIYCSNYVISVQMVVRNAHRKVPIDSYKSLLTSALLQLEPPALSHHLSDPAALSSASRAVPSRWTCRRVWRLPCVMDCSKPPPIATPRVSCTVPFQSLFSLSRPLVK